MKYSTLDLYGIDPKELADLPYKQALIRCKEAANLRLNTLVFRDIPLFAWTDKDQLMHKELDKAVKWCTDKLDELSV